MLSWFFTFVEIILVGFIVLNATFKNISVISWRSVLLVEETSVPGENHLQKWRKNQKHKINFSLQLSERRC